MIKRYEEHPDGGMREDELGKWVEYDLYKGLEARFEASGKLYNDYADKLVKNENLTTDCAKSVASMTMEWLNGPGEFKLDISKRDRLATIIARRMRRYFRWLDFDAGE